MLIKRKKAKGTNTNGAGDGGKGLPRRRSLSSSLSAGGRGQEELSRKLEQSVKSQIRESKRPCGIQWREGSREWGQLGAGR